MKKPVLLMILDGWGIAPADKTNAAAMAKTPNLDSYFANYPHTTLEASGKAEALYEQWYGRQSPLKMPKRNFKFDSDQIAE